METPEKTKTDELRAAAENSIAGQISDSQNLNELLGHLNNVSSVTQPIAIALAIRLIGFIDIRSSSEYSSLKDYIKRGVKFENPEAYSNFSILYINKYIEIVNPDGETTSSLEHLITLFYPHSTQGKREFDSVLV